MICYQKIIQVDKIILLANIHPFVGTYSNSAIDNQSFGNSILK